jgi:glucosamine-6-phosphate deaminase
VRVVIEKSPEAVYKTAAAWIAELIRSKPNCVLGLATGRTMVPFYAELVRLHEEGLRLQDVVTFNLDEYVGVAPEDPRSFSYFMHQHLVSRTDLAADCVYLPVGSVENLFAEADDYETRIKDAGGIDLQLLGLGRNGHLGFNEPGSSLRSLTRVKALTSDTLVANEQDLPDLGSGRPDAAITMGLGTILDARRCFLLALGESKADAVAAMIEGSVTAHVPASALQLHRQVTVLLDSGAASALHDQDYYLRAEKMQRKLEGRTGPG